MRSLHIGTVNMNGQTSEFLKGFRNPSPEYGVKPFWFWNAKMDASEIAAQIQNFHLMGLGGFFIHARFGLETQYMSDEWLDAVEVAVNEAETYGMEIWFYDENLFPSGIGNTKVSGRMDCRVRFIEYDVFHTVPDPEGAYIPLSALPDGCELFSAQQVSDEGQNLLCYRVDEQQKRVLVDKEGEVALFWINTIHSGNGMIFGVDYLNPETLRAFIECTHEIYRRRFKRRFGKVIKGFFTDEPTLLPWHHDGGWYTSRNNGRCAPYTPMLTAEMARDGAPVSDLAIIAGALFFDCGDTKQAGDLRCFYWRTVSRLYRDNFFKAYAKWCEDNELMLTGHVLLEEGLYFNHIFQAGPLPGLSFMHMPGVDQLTSAAESGSMSYMVGTRPYMPAVKTNVTGPKLVSSIAHTAGRRRVLSESFGLGGWGLQYRHMKAIIDWEYALGVNALCPHAFFYSIKGFRKNDAPPCHYHGADASLYKYFADYAARISWALSQGEPVADTAVLYPESAFRRSYAVGRQRGRDAAISDAFDLVCAGMLNEHRLYEIITEGDLASARIEGGALTIETNAPESAIQECACGTGGLRFKHIIIASPEGLNDDALTLLERFADSGGRLLVFNDGHGSQIRHTDGARRSVCPAKNMTRSAICKILSGFLRDDNIDGMQLTGEGNDMVYALCRKTPVGNIWFFANTDDERGFCGRVAFSGRHIVMLDAENGEYAETGGSCAELNMAPAGSALMLVADGICGSAEIMPRPALCPENIEVENDGWTFNTDGCNALHIRRWAHEINCHGMTTEYRYIADIESETDVNDAYIALDDVVSGSSVMGAGDISVFFNGDICSPAGWHIGKGFPAYYAANGLKKDKNTLMIVIKCEAWSGEPQPLKYGAVLLGRFGVKKSGEEWRIMPEPAFVSLSPWNEQGYPFYSGSARYSKRVRLPGGGPFIIDLDNAEGAVQLFINGQNMGARLWAPFRWVVENGENAGDMEITVAATNTLANYLGEICPSGPRGPMRITPVIKS